MSIYDGGSVDNDVMERLRYWSGVPGTIAGMVTGRTTDAARKANRRAVARDRSCGTCGEPTYVFRTVAGGWRCRGCYWQDVFAEGPPNRRARTATPDVT
jgi:ribosomal protein L37AE/L43A